MKKETRNKIGLMVFGLTLFPALVYGIVKWFLGPSATLMGFYTYIYGSLMDMGKDGMVAWGIVCGPYMVYELLLLVHSFSPGGRSSVPGKPESGAVNGAGEN